MKAILQKFHNQWLLNFGNSDNLLTFAPTLKSFYLSSGTEVCLYGFQDLEPLL